MGVIKMISVAQCAFVHGRQILYQVLTTNECLDLGHKLRRPSIICKLDLEKVYNKVDDAAWERESMG